MARRSNSGNLKATQKSSNSETKINTVLKRAVILSLILAMARLVVKVLVKQISLICFRAYLEVYVAKNPTCFSRWSFSRHD